MSDTGSRIVPRSSSALRALASLALLTACATAQVTDEPLRGPAVAPPAPCHPERGAMTTHEAIAVFDGVSGARLTPAEVTARLAGARHVHVGERHGDHAFHAVQGDVLETLRRAGRDVAVAVEWLPPSATPALVRWLASDDAVDELARAVDWPRTWGHAFDAYAPIFTWAREHAVPIVGINAEHELARAVARAPLDELDPDLRARLPPLDTWDAAHFEHFRAMMEAVMHAHPLSAAAMDRYYLAQLVRDEAMSLGAAQLLADPAHPERVVVVLAGLGHIAHGHGVPLRLARVTELPFVIVRPLASDEARARGLGGDATQATETAPPYPEREADLLWQPRCAPLEGPPVAAARSLSTDRAPQ